MDLAALIPSFGSVLWTVLAFVIALSIIVAIHEYGHYIVGRWSGIKADVFSIGFGPVLFKGTDRHGTQWQIAALPLGGYVKFKGDANAASAPDGDLVSGLTPDEKRMTMQGAPLWARPGIGQRVSSHSGAAGVGRQRFADGMAYRLMVKGR